MRFGAAHALFLPKNPEKVMGFSGIVNGKTKTQVFRILFVVNSNGSTV